MSAAELSQEELSFLFKFIHEKSAIVLDETKDYLIYNRLTPLLKQNEINSLNDLVKEIKSNKNARIINEVIDALTTNETLFFRDLKPFEVLRASLLPKILEENKASKSLRIWSAACSTGQEPYSLAMMLLENFPQLKDWKVEIFASDISKESLEKAKEGIYSQIEVNRGLPIKMLVKYFSNEQGRWKVKPELRKMVNFQELNFIEAWPHMSKFDFIFVRNVLIYFGLETKKTILDRMANLLSHKGYLFLGASESLIRLEVPFKTVILDNTRCFQIK